jgi:Family of unknown function (DUF5681)
VRPLGGLGLGAQRLRKPTRACDEVLRTRGQFSLLELFESGSVAALRLVYGRENSGPVDPTEIVLGAGGREPRAHVEREGFRQLRSVRESAAIGTVCLGLHDFHHVRGDKHQYTEQVVTCAALVSTKIGGQPGIGFEDRIKSLAIEEAYRLITIREGDRTERIPVIQAILRKVAVAAANGNIRAQQNYLNLLIGAEADRRVATMELLMTAVDYKEHWHHELAERARKGTTGPEPVPHPDDVIIDYDTGKIRFDGPVEEEQKEAQTRLRTMWPDMEQSLKEINEEIESNPNDLRLRKIQKKDDEGRQLAPRRRPET